VVNEEGREESEREEGRSGLGLSWNVGDGADAELDTVDDCP
jgi:hypothetical protein